MSTNVATYLRGYSYYILYRFFAYVTALINYVRSIGELINAVLLMVMDKIQLFLSFFVVFSKMRPLIPKYFMTKLIEIYWPMKMGHSRQKSLHKENLLNGMLVLWSFPVIKKTFIHVNYKKINLCASC